MNEGILYLLLADSILVIHFAFVLFVVVGFVLILAGLWHGWDWVNIFWFRISHLLAIGVVVAQAWLGRACPLTVWESMFRAKAGEAGYQVDFLQYWVHKILYFNAPAWVFTLIYTVFAALVLLVWLFGDRLQDWRRDYKNSCKRAN